MSSIDRITPYALARAVNRDYEALRWLRDRGRRAWDAFLGHDFGREEMGLESVDVWEGSPQNLTAQQVKALLPTLAFTNPAADITSDLDALETFDAEMLRQAADKDAEELDLEEKYQDAALDCILRGIVCHVVTTRTANNLIRFRDREAEPGGLLEEPVDLEDVCWDSRAKRFRQRRREAYRRLIDVNDAIEWGFYGRDDHELDPAEPAHPFLATRDEARKMLEDAQRVTAGDLQRISDRWRSSGGDDDDDELGEEVWVWDVIVFAGDGSTWVFSMLGDEEGVDETAERFLLAERYDGPGHGPLHWFSLLPAGAGVCPTSLDAMQKDLAVVADALTNKVVRATLRTKQNLIYKPQAREEMRAILDADEDEAIAGDPSNYAQVQSGGLLNDIVLGSGMVNDWWNNVTNGAQMAAGLEDKGKGTATAFQGMMNRVMNWMRFLQRRLERWATSCLRTRLWHRLEDPMFARVLRYRLPNTETIDVRYDQKMRRGRFWDFNIKVRAYSAEVQDPVLRAQRITEALAPGGAVDAVLQKVMVGILRPKAVRDLARLLDLPELESWLNDPAMQMRMMMQQAATQAAGGPPGAPQPGASAGPGFGGGGMGTTGTQLSPLGMGASPRFGRPAQAGGGAAPMRIAG